MRPRPAFYEQLSCFVAKGTGLLDSQSIGEIKQFVTSLQNTDGGFSDRAGYSDLYYSLFAHFILKSFRFTGHRKSLKCFISEKGKMRNKHLVDLCCLSILYKELSRSRLSGWKYLFAALKQVKNNLSSGTQEYRYFLLLITLDAYGFNNLFTRWFARRFYPDGKIPDGLPCPALSALIVFKKQLGYGVASDCNMLASFFDGQSGFRVSASAGTADLLSTSVALFALKTSNFDITLLAPACLRFVEGNFREGAFLPGDGDEHRDLEYTFYGLLALGALA